MAPRRLSQRQEMLRQLTRRLLHSELADLYAGLLCLALAALGAFAGFSGRPLGFLLAAAAVPVAVTHLLLRVRIRRNAEGVLGDFRDALDATFRKVLTDYPRPVALVRDDGAVLLANEAFLALAGRRDVLGRPIGEVVPGFSVAGLAVAGTEVRRVEAQGRRYDVVASSSTRRGRPVPQVLMGGAARVLTLYFEDVTAYEERIETLEGKREATALLLIDNYEDLVRETPEERRPAVLASIERALKDWSGFTGGMVTHLEKDRFLLVFEIRFLKAFESRRFDLLDRVREIRDGNRIPPTLSIGVGVDGSTPGERLEHAQNCLDIALGRGGDQAVLFRDDAFSFYGGTSQAAEKHSRVRSRVVSHALEDMFRESDRVFVMGHRNPDPDSLGAAIGIARLAAACGKEAAVLLGPYGDEILPFVELLAKRGRVVFVRPEQAIVSASKEDALVVVDTMRPGQVLEPRMIQETGRLAVVDHHRKSADFFKEAALALLEPYASSTCELVTELLSYSHAEIDLSPEEADAIFAGMLIDTKNFTTRTGIRTFEAAAYLRKKGADPDSVRRILADDLDTFLAVADVVRAATLREGGFAFAGVRAGQKNAGLIAAKAADQLLNIAGVNASFVLAPDADGVSVSARSNGGVNVQVIMERLGGGGHLTQAGSRLQGLRAEEAEARVLDAIHRETEHAVKAKEAEQGKGNGGNGR